MSDTHYVSLSDICYLCNVSDQTVRNWIKKNRLPPVAIVSPKGWRLWKREEIEQFAKERTEKKDNKVKI